MVTPAQYNNLKIYRGATFDLSLNWKDEAGALYDLSNHSAALTFYDIVSDRAIKELTSAPGGGIVLSNVEFNIDAKMTVAETDALVFDSANKARFRLEITSPDGTETDRIIEGEVTIHD